MAVAAVELVETGRDERLSPPVIAMIGGLTLFLNLGHPAQGLVDIPLSFFLKNRLHYSAGETALFHLLAYLPLFLGFLFGFARDLWSPFGRGDRGHILVFGALTVGVYLVLAGAPASSLELLFGMLAALTAYQMVFAAVGAIAAAIGRDNAAAGAVSALQQSASYIPQILGFLLGGVLSSFLESQSSGTASRLLFTAAAAAMAVVVVLGALAPRAVYRAGDEGRRGRTLVEDFRRAVRHRPLWLIAAIQFLWQFSPGTATALQYHLTDDLHGTDFQWGAWNALFLAGFLPVYLAYSFLCRRAPLRILLWAGFAIAILQMAALFLPRTAAEAVWAALLVGALGAIAQASLFDLVIRSSPRGLEGSVVMMFIAVYWTSFRLGDSAGALLSERLGFGSTLVATMITTGSCLLLLLLVPARLTATRDGEPLPDPEARTAAA